MLCMPSYQITISRKDPVIKAYYDRYNLIIATFETICYIEHI